VGNPQHNRDGNGCFNKARFESFHKGSVVLVKPSKPSSSLRYGAEREGPRAAGCDTGDWISQQFIA
jgi:hypothetical protein